MRDHLIKGLADYFGGEHWNYFIREHLLPEDDEIYHAHAWMHTCIHPDSLIALTDLFWEKQGRPSLRKTDPVCVDSDYTALHCVHPLGLPHYDFNLRYNKEVVLAPIPEGGVGTEAGKHTLSWGKRYQDAFMAQYRGQFQCVGPREEREIDNWFLSRHWKEALELTLDPEITHCHANVEINFEPKILQMRALEIMRDMGWRMDRSVLTVYHLGEGYTGKIVFLLGYPEKVFDICWKFNPDVTIRRAPVFWRSPIKGFDLNYVRDHEECLERFDFIALTEEEIDAVAATFKKVM